MLYFFAAIDDYIGFESPVHNPEGEWPKGRMVVKYAKSINFETFQTCMLVGDEDEQLTEPELEIVFSECDNEDEGIKMLCNNDILQETQTLIQMVSDSVSGLNLQNRRISILMKDSDLKFGNWKRAKAFLTD